MEPHQGVEQLESEWWDHGWFLCLQAGLWGVSAVLSAIVFVGLLIPLLIQLKKGSHTTANSQRSSNRSSSGRVGPSTKYSIFNLYLVYLAVGDLALSLYGMYVTVRWKFLPMHLIMNSSKFYLLPGDPSGWERLVLYYILYTWFSANAFLNATMCHQTKKLLETSQRAQRLNQPSLTTVNLQGAAAYLLPAIGISGVFLPSVFRTTHYIYVTASYVSILYIIGTTVMVWWKGYIPPVKGVSASARAARELAFYFYRICGAYILILIPAAIVSFLSRPVSTPIAGLLVSVNPIATFCVILKKSDAKRYIVELVTLSYVFGIYNGCRCNRVDRKHEVVERTAPMRTVTTILGFDITEDREEDPDSPNGDTEANICSDVEGMNAKSGTDSVGGTDTGLGGQHKE
jgi:hypothetical protein